MLKESIQRMNEKASRLTEDFAQLKEMVCRVRSLASNRVRDSYS